MAMTSRRLAAYLELERQMLSLDAVKDPLADRLRDVMDTLWYGLTDEEHSLLDSRIADESDVALDLTLTKDEVERLIDRLRQS